MKGFLLLPFLILISHSSSAQWQKVGSPNGGMGQSIIVNGTHVIAACNDGVFYSTDNANTWTKSQMPGVYINGFYNYGNKIIAYGEGGFWQTYDNGETFTPLSSGWNGLKISFVASFDTLLWCGAYNTGLYYSSDSGATWTQQNSNLNLHPTPFAMIKLGGDFILATDSTVFRSSDNCATWTPSDSGLPSLHVSALLSFNNMIFAGTYGAQIYQSTDNGISWHVSGSQLSSAYVHSLYSVGSYIYATTVHEGVKISSDSGQTWISRYDSLTVRDVTSIFEQAGTFYITTFGGGIYLSTDNGISWIKKSSGIESRCDKMAIANNKIYLATNGDGIHVSMDDGLTWNSIFEQSGKGNCEAICATGLEIYSGGWGHGIVHSSDGGNSWTSIDNGIMQPQIMQLNNFFLDSPAVWINGDQYTYKSLDHGNTWVLSDSGMSYLGSLSMARLGDTLFAGVFINDVYRSFDNGTFWQHDTNGINHDNVFTFQVIGNVVYALALNGIWSSWDYGDTWTQINNLNGVTCSVLDGTDIYVGTAYQGAYVSHDFGYNWLPITSGLPYYPVMRDIKIHNGYLIASLQNQGMWRYSLANIVSNEIISNKLLVFPNPATNNILISWGISQPEVCIEISDVLGRTIKTFQAFNTTQTTLDLEISKGLYFVSVKNKNFQSTNKLIIH